MSTDWLPRILDETIPIYRSIVEAIVRDTENQVLRPGARMPTHRELARRMGVNVGTITRAFAEARDLGLLSGEIGRGTFVSGPALEARPGGEPGPIELTLNKPVTIDNGAFLRKTLSRIADGHALTQLLEYPPAAGARTHRAAGAKLAALGGVEADPDQVVLTCGAQQGLAACLGVFCKPGDVVATEALNYAGIRGLCDLLGLTARGVAIDDEGMIPESLDAACKRETVTALVVTPTIHNPTTATMGAQRRAALIRAAARHRLAIIEDDVYGALVEQRLHPLYAMAKSPACYVFGVSKSLASGLRLGYVVAPPERIGPLNAAIRAMTWTVAPLNAEIVSQWVHDGTAGRIMAGHRAEIARRQDLARAILGEGAFQSHPQSYHLWLPLPAPWRLHDFVEACAREGVSVSPGSLFAIEPTYAPNAVRISLGAQRDIERVREGLARVGRTLRGPSSADALQI
jgi:DNA-binding transcriptional MocR family regulator